MKTYLLTLFFLILSISSCTLSRVSESLAQQKIINDQLRACNNTQDSESPACLLFTKTTGIKRKFKVRRLEQALKIGTLEALSEYESSIANQALSGNTNYWETDVQEAYAAANKIRLKKLKAFKLDPEANKNVPLDWRNIALLVDPSFDDKDISNPNLAPKSHNFIWDGELTQAIDGVLIFTHEKGQFSVSNIKMRATEIRLNTKYIVMGTYKANESFRTGMGMITIPQLSDARIFPWEPHFWYHRTGPAR